MFRWWSHHTVHSYVLMTRTISMVQHLFQQREWTDRQGRRIRQPRQWVVQTFPSRRGPVLHFSSLPSPRPSIKQHWWILCRCGRCFNAAWNCLVFQTTPSVRLSRHLYLFLFYFFIVFNNQLISSKWWWKHVTDPLSSLVSTHVQ